VSAGGGALRVLEQVRGSGVIGIVRTGSADQALRQGCAAVEAGLDVLEVSLVTPGALGVIEELALRYPDATIGAGTVLDRAQALDVVRAGGRILVCPTTSVPVIHTARDHDVAVVPGCLSPTEMQTAMAHGATAVKIFPAQVWSPEALHGLLQALPDLPCVPTGGIRPVTAPSWIAARANAVGVGAALSAAENPGRSVSDLISAISDARVEHAR